MKYLILFSFIILFLHSCTNYVKEENTNGNTFYDQAFEFREKGMSDSAYFYFNQAKNLFLQQRDSLGVGKCLVNMGIISNDKGDYFSSQEISLNALSYFNKKKKDQYIYISSNFNNLGIATNNLKNYKDALKFYDSAIQFSRNSSDIRLYQINRAKIYQILTKYEAALKIYNSVLKKSIRDNKEYTRILTNLALTKWLQDSNYNAIPDYLKALHIREKEKDLLGQNSSYSHLSDFYAKKMPDSALFYARMMYQISKEINSPDDKLTALQKLVRLSPSKETKQYFEIYQDLNDSLQTARRIAKNQFALISYETERHKADFLKAQAENIQKQNNILRKNFVLVILILLLIGGYLWYRKRKKGLQQEKELEVKNTEIKYVKKIHDRVANKVYQVMSEVENNPKLHRNIILNKLEVLYNISRDISYEGKEVNTEVDYAKQLTKMLTSYASETTQVFVITNEEEVWKGISNDAKAEVYYVLQELMTNMSKHSKAGTVVIKFRRNDGHISISYHDNGIGIKEESKKNGLTNTENRINGIGGTIKFDSIQEGELNIQISFPFS